MTLVLVASVTSECSDESVHRLILAFVEHMEKLCSVKKPSQCLALLFSLACMIRMFSTTHDGSTIFIDAG